MDLGSMCFLEQFDGLLDGIGECSTLDQGDGKAKKTWEADDTRDRRRNEKNRRRHQGETPDDKDPTNVIDEMLQIIEDKDSEIGRLKEKNEKAVLQIQDLERRSNAITSEMAKVMDEKGNFECINDEFANSNITEKFYKLYDNEWVHLSRKLGKLDTSLSELELIHKLTEMLKYVYEECCYTAECQIRQFFLLTENDPTPTQTEYPELYASRRKYARTDAVRRRLIQIVWKKLEKSEEIGYFMVGSSRGEVVEALQNFFEKCIDYCWLMIVSNPPVKLDFNVLGINHSECMDRFRIYSVKQPVIDPGKEEGTICEVVWPCVCLKGGSACYKKGEVVIYQTEKKTDGMRGGNKRFKENKVAFKLDEIAQTQMLEEIEMSEIRRNHQHKE